MSTTGTIEVENVWKTFRIFHQRSTTLKQAVIGRKRDEFEDFWALRDVSFTIPSGSTFGLIGANGAGKSTMLKVLARILVPDKGHLRVGGRVSALLELGAGFHPELSGRENVFLNGTILGMPSAVIKRKFDDIVGFAGLETFIDQPVKTYSSGMFARLGFAVAVAVEPDILLLDEVLAVGDEQFQRRCAEKMNELRSGGRTVVLVSHSLPNVQQMCDQAVWLDHGSVQTAGATEDVVDAYLASVTTAYRLDSQGRPRSGSGEIQLEAELVPSPDERSISTDEPLTLRFHWTTEQRLENIGFTFSIRAGDGYVVGGEADVRRDSSGVVGPGAGWVEYAMPKLGLLPGAYHVAAAIVDRSSGHVYDHCTNLVTFDVSASHGSGASVGVVDLRGAWNGSDGAGR